MADRVHIDVETFSECDLKKCGAYRYAEDPTTELNCLVFAFNDEPPELWVPRDDLPSELVARTAAHLQSVGGKFHIGKVCPDRLRIHIECGGKVAAHNAQFERVILNGIAGVKLNFPKLTIDQMICTAAKCAVYGLPRALGDAAKIMGTRQKDDVGRTDMLACAKPRTGKDPRWTPHNAPDRFFNLFYLLKTKFYLIW